jgi:hypothetical protein
MLHVLVRYAVSDQDIARPQWIMLHVVATLPWSPPPSFEGRSGRRAASATLCAVGVAEVVSGSSSMRCRGEPVTGDQRRRTWRDPLGVSEPKPPTCHWQVEVSKVNSL